MNTILVCNFFYEDHRRMIEMFVTKPKTHRNSTKKIIIALGFAMAVFFLKRTVKNCEKQQRRNRRKRLFLANLYILNHWRPTYFFSSKHSPYICTLYIFVEQ